MAALPELAESFIAIIKKYGGATTPDIDIVAEAMRNWLRKGYDVFQRQILKTFESILSSKTKRAEAVEEFYRVNKLRIAELVLSEKEIK